MNALLPGGVLWHLDLDNRSVPFRNGERYMMGEDGLKPLEMLKNFCSIEEEIPVTAWPDYPEHDAGVLRKLVRK